MTGGRSCSPSPAFCHLCLYCSFLSISLELGVCYFQLQGPHETTSFSALDKGCQNILKTYFLFSVKGSPASLNLVGCHKPDLPRSGEKGAISPTTDLGMHSPSPLINLHLQSDAVHGRADLAPREKKLGVTGPPGDGV